MDKKSKTPAPPKVQAPQRRAGSRPPAPGSGDNRRLLIIGGIAAASIAAVVALFAFLSTDGNGAVNDDEVREAMVAAGCTFESKAAKPFQDSQVHAPEGSKLTWPTQLPSGGPHYGQTAIWGFYTDPVDPRFIVHNQEHGGVVLWWGPDTPQQTVEEMRSLYEADPFSMFGTQIGKLGSKVGITAWFGDQERYGSEEDYFGEGKSAVCDEFDRGAFETFRDAYRGKGPEPFAIEDNQPGGS